MSRAWWRRNAAWLIALVPVLALALVASAFRLSTLHLPWEWSRPIDANGPTGTLTQKFRGFDDADHDREVTVEVLQVAAVPSLDGHAAIDGATLWQVDLRLSAAPDQLLATTCTIELVDADGARYGILGGRQAADPDDIFHSAYVPLQSCVPEEAPGPSLDPFSGELVPSPAPRPQSWEVTTSMVLPDGYEPRQVRIGWDRPTYLVLDVPA